MKADVNSRPTVASIYSGGTGSGSAQPSRSHPFSSIATSPDGSYAVASGKDPVLHVLRLNLDQIEEIRSVRISQHFQSPISTTPVSRGQNPQYPHLRDALRLPGAAHSASATLPTPSAAGGGGGINININDVAWSLPQSYVVDGAGSFENSGNNSGSDHGLGDSYEELLSPTDASEHQHDNHFPSFVKRVYKGQGIGEESQTQLDDTSVVAAAGSNGVVVAWSARDLSLPHLPDESGGSFFPARKNVRGSKVGPPSASIGQPEAAFLAHSRAVNRLVWHPTGRRPYLLLTASQDGSVKLWDRRATSASSTGGGSGARSSGPISHSTINLSSKSWFGFGAPSTQNDQVNLSSQIATAAIWHCVSTYQPKCEAVRDIKWNPFIDDVFAMVAGEWLCVYDIRINNKPMVKESMHAGDCTSVDWHPTQRYTIATGGGRDRSVKVWDLESSLNIHKQDDASANNFKMNSGSFRSENSETVSSHSSEGPITSLSEHGGPNTQNANQTTLGSLSNLSAGSSPVRRVTSATGLSHSRQRKKPPLHVLHISAPVTRIRWRPPAVNSDCNYHDSMIAVATASIYGANAGGNGSVGLWSYHRPFMPISVCEGHLDGAVSDFAWARDLSKETIASGSTEEKLSSNRESYTREWQTIITVGRDGRILLQNFSHGQRPILEVPHATFALANLSPFQPGFGSLQIMAVHQRVDALEILNDAKANPSPPQLSRALIFSTTDSGDASDLTKASLPANVDIAPELTHLSRFSELYVTSTGSKLATKADVCRHNATVANGLNQKAITQMWKTFATILDGSGLDGLPSNLSNSHSNPMAYVLMPTLRNLLLQRANAGDVQSCVAVCEVMEVILPPSAAGGSAKCRIPNLSITVVREWYMSYIDLLQQMCLFTQAASLIRNCHDPTIGALNQQSTTIHESCPRCGKPLLGGTAIQANAGTSPQLSAQRVCRSCRQRVGMCFLCHEPVNGIFVWCPGCGHGGHLDHALEWFGMNEVCPTGCGHKCNLFPVQSQ